MTITNDEIFEISKEYVPEDDMWLTTGFISILFAMYLFKNVKIAGFGICGCIESLVDPPLVYGGHIKGKNHHNMNNEHRLIDQMVADRLITRFEDLT